MENSSLGMGWTDLDGTLLYANGALARMIGVASQEEAIGVNVQSLYDEATRENLVKEVFPALLRGESWSGEALMRPQDGDPVPTTNALFLLHGPEGEPAFFANIIGDLSDAKAAGREFVRRREYLEDQVAVRTERFRLAANLVSDHIYEWDIVDDTLLWFGDIDRALGFEPGEISQTIAAWIGRIHPEDLERMSDAVELHRTSTDPIHYEYQIQRKDGSWRIWDDRGVPVLDEEGKPRKWIGVCTDITRRRRSEALQGSLRDLALNLSAAGGLDEALTICLQTAISVSQADSGGIYLADPSSHALDLVVASGLSEEFVEAGAYHAADSPQAAAVQAGNAIYASTEELPPFLDSVQQQEGLKALAVIPILNEGRIIACINVASHTRRTVPHRVRMALEMMASQIGSTIARALAQERMYEQQEMFRALAENSIDTIMRFDRNHRHLYINPIVESQTGIPAEQFLGKTHAELGFPVHLTTLWEESIDQVFRTGDPHRVEFELPSGIWLDWQLVPEFAADGGVAAVITSARDITERKEAEAERTHLEEKLHHSQKMEAIGLLAGGVAHDFNNVLCAIQGNAELTRRILSDGDPLRQAMDEIVSASERAAALTRQLLAFSRKQVIEPKVINLSQLIESLHKMLVRLIGEDILLRTVPQPKLGMVFVDPGQVEQIVLNLAINARDAMPNGGELHIETADVTLDDEYCVKHPTATPGDYVTLAVSDTGSGMSAAVRERVFDPFFTTKQTGQGTGLGLATVYGIVEQHGGRIEVHSEPGEGSSFEVFFPRATSDVGAEDRAEFHEPATGQETVLIVEDEEMVLNLAARLLESYGYDVLAAGSGSDALAVVEQHEGTIDLLLTDVVMPMMNGAELADALTEKRPGLKVLFTSGYTQDVIAKHGVLGEGVHFIAKPYSLDSLAAKVRQVLDT